jgi:hypothetical protein
MLDPTAAVQTRIIEPNALGDIVAISSKSTGNTDMAGASSELDKPEIHTEVATAGWGISGIQGSSEDISTPGETLINHLEPTSNNGTSETITEAIHIRHPKQVPTRSHNTTIANVGKSITLESRPKSTNNDSGASESLLHRLAGPSVGKAGLARDQTEITRVIARVSEGSKYYEVSRCPGDPSLISNLYSVPQPVKMTLF